MRTYLIPLALVLTLSTAHAGRRDGDGELIQRKAPPSIVQLVLAALTGNAETADGRDNHLGNS